MLEDIIYKKPCLIPGGKTIDIYKFRTMGQCGQYVFDELGKPSENSNISGFGKFMRKYFLDELPQLYNLLKGDIGLVGIRPRTEDDWKRFPREHKNESLKYKSGLFGVQYSSKASCFADLLNLEAVYLIERQENERKTQIKYFFKIIGSIIFGGVRSR